MTNSTEPGMTPERVAKINRIREELHRRSDFYHGMTSREESLFVALIMNTHPAVFDEIVENIRQKRAEKTQAAATGQTGGAS